MTVLLLGVDTTGVMFFEIILFKRFIMEYLWMKYDIWDHTVKSSKRGVRDKVDEHTKETDSAMC